MKHLIRSAAEDDVETILSFITKLAEYEHLADQVRATGENLRRYGFSTRPFFHVLLAEDEQRRPLGFALYFFTFSTFAGRPTLFLEDLFVLPEHRAKGIGTALFSRLAAVACEHDCGRMEWSVLTWNEPAIRFYQSLGAKPMNDWRVYRWGKEAISRLADRNQSDVLDQS
jgi:GNAT superfamily N-acetyltransferase